MTWNRAIVIAVTLTLATAQWEYRVDSEGALQILPPESRRVPTLYNEWLYLCGDGFGPAEATVACRSLRITNNELVGYFIVHRAAPPAAVWDNSTDANATGLRDGAVAECQGSESSLAACALTFPVTCRIVAVGVRCMGYGAEKFRVPLVYYLPAIGLWFVCFCCTCRVWVTRGCRCARRRERNDDTHTVENATSPPPMGWSASPQMGILVESTQPSVARVVEPSAERPVGAVEMAEYVQPAALPYSVSAREVKETGET